MPGKKCPFCGEQADQEQTVCACGYEYPGAVASNGDGGEESDSVVTRAGKDLAKPPRGVIGTGTFTPKEEGSDKVSYPLLRNFAKVLLMVAGVGMVSYYINERSPYSVDGSGPPAYLFFLGSLLTVVAIFALVSPFFAVKSLSITLGDRAITYRRRTFYAKEWRLAYADIADISYQTTVRIHRSNAGRDSARERVETEESTYDAVVARHKGNFDRGDGETIQDALNTDPSDAAHYTYSCCLTARDGDVYTISSDEYPWMDFKQIIALVEGNAWAARGGREAVGDPRPLELRDETPVAEQSALKDQTQTAETSAEKRISQNGTVGTQEEGNAAVAASVPPHAHALPQVASGTGTFTTREENKPGSLFLIIPAVLLLVLGSWLVYDNFTDPFSFLSETGDTLLLVSFAFFIKMFGGRSGKEQSVNITVGQDSVTYRNDEEWRIAYADITNISYQWGDEWSDDDSEQCTYEEFAASYERGAGRSEDGTNPDEADADQPDEPFSKCFCRITARGGSAYTINSDEFSWKEFLQIIALIEGNARQASPWMEK